MAVFRRQPWWCLLAFLWPALGFAADYVPEVVRELVRPGQQPLGTPLVRADGTVVGTTVSGGAFGGGTVWQWSPKRGLEWLHHFAGPEGRSPTAALLEGPDGTLFGTTSEGGAGGFGVLFQIAPDGVFDVLAEFTGAAGSVPGSVPDGLCWGPDGLLYGVTGSGGGALAGTVFRLSAAGAFESLVAFSGTGGAAPGRQPVGALVGQGGFLYGVTRFGGAGDVGTVFRLAVDGSFTSQAAFTGVAGAHPGANPSGGLCLGPGGDLFGTTEFGGANGVGTAFAWQVGAGQLVSLHAFADATGSQPAGPLALGPDGQLYGATAVGGAAGWGSLFRLDGAGHHTLLVSLTGVAGAAPGAAPRGGVAVDAAGDLWLAAGGGGPGDLGQLARWSGGAGYVPEAAFTTALGWAPNGLPASDGDGGWLIGMAAGGDAGGGEVVRLTGLATVRGWSSFGGNLGSLPIGGLRADGGQWQVVTNEGGSHRLGAWVTLDGAGHALDVPSWSTTAGEDVQGPLVRAGDGNLYGVSRAGGLTGNGALFRVFPDGTVARVFSFTGLAGPRPGAQPLGPLALGSDGRLFGVAEAGGAGDAGVLFAVATDGTYALLAEFSASGPRRPRGGLVAAPDGLVWGSLSAGGANDAGSLLVVDPAVGAWSVRADFPGAAAAGPVGTLALASSGDVLGLTQRGGLDEAGVVFRCTPAGTLSVCGQLADLGGATPPAPLLERPGRGPLTGGVVEAENGALLGVLPAGAGGGGLIFRLRPSGPFEAWKDTFLGNVRAADLGDPDADGLVNLVEYVLGQNPAVADGVGAGAGLPVVTANGAWGLELWRDPARSDVVAQVLAASTPDGPWTVVATSTMGGAFVGSATVIGENGSANPHFVRIFPPGSPGAGSPTFWRLEVRR